MNSDHQKEYKDAEYFVISGMHRSGTSLVASYLKLCGLDIGKNLVPPYRDNVFGYYEDIDFVNFHNKILNKNKKNILNADKLKFDETDVKDAINLLKKKRQLGQTSWKDPRTVLFLDFWQKILNDYKFLFLFRHPYFVIDSLFRRKTDRILNLRPYLSAKSWITYNKKILSFHKQNLSGSILVNIEDFIKYPVEIVDKLKNKFFLKLHLLSFDKVYNKKYFKQNSIEKTMSKIIIAFYKKPLLDVYLELEYFKLRP